MYSDVIPQSMYWPSHMEIIKLFIYGPQFLEVIH